MSSDETRQAIRSLCRGSDRGVTLAGQHGSVEVASVDDIELGRVVVLRGRDADGRIGETATLFRAVDARLLAGLLMAASMEWPEGYDDEEEE